MPGIFLILNPALTSISVCGLQEVARLCSLCQGVLASVRQAIEELEGAAEAEEEEEVWTEVE